MLDQAATEPASSKGSPARGGRRAARHEATKAEILDAAWAMVRAQGLESLSMRDLAAAVGMRAPSLYQYFDSKLAIYDAMFGQGAHEALDALRAAVSGREAVDALRKGARAILVFSTEDPVRNQLLFQRTIPGFTPSTASYAPAVDLVATMEGLIAQARITDEEALDLLSALVSGLSNQQLSNDPGGTRWVRLMDRAFDMFLVEVHPESATTTKER